MFEKQLFFGYFAIKVLRIFILPLFFIIIGDSEQRDIWRQHCNVKNLVIIQTDPNKQAYHPLRLFRKVWNFFPKQFSREERCTGFVKCPHPSISQADLLPIVLRAACGFLRRQLLMYVHWTCMACRWSCYLWDWLMFSYPSFVYATTERQQQVRNNLNMPSPGAVVLSAVFILLLEFP